MPGRLGQIEVVHTRDIDDFRDAVDTMRSGGVGDEHPLGVVTVDIHDPQIDVLKGIQDKVASGRMFPVRVADVNEVSDGLFSEVTGIVHPSEPPTASSRAKVMTTETDGGVHIDVSIPRSVTSASLVKLARHYTVYGEGELRAAQYLADTETIAGMDNAIACSSEVERLKDEFEELAVSVPLRQGRIASFFANVRLVTALNAYNVPLMHDVKTVSEKRVVSV